MSCEWAYIVPAKITKCRPNEGIFIRTAFSSIFGIFIRSSRLMSTIPSIELTDSKTFVTPGKFHV